MIQKLDLSVGDRVIHLQVIHSARKSLGLEVRGAEDVLVRVPAGLPDREIRRFIEEHRQWMMDKTRLVEKRQNTRLSTGAVPPERLSLEEVQKIQEKIASRVQHYRRIMGVSVGRITIRNQKSRWGSCSSKGNLANVSQVLFKSF